MTSLDPHALLLTCRTPGTVANFSPEDWNQALRAARNERLLARLGYRIEDAGVLDDCPEVAREQLLAARAYPTYLQTQVTRELRHLTRALAVLDTDLILLKGGAYLSLPLPLSRGRQLRDLDILVRREDIGDIERRLLDQGWESQVEDAYDQRYYRTWMHEIPPLRHAERGLEVDIHHTLLPLTSRIKPDPELFWAASVPVAGMPRVRALCPADQVLHTSTHLFYDGEVRGGLSDLWDIDGLLRLFARDPAFWDALLARAAQTGLGRPLYYGLAFSRRLLGTPIPDPFLALVRSRFGPGWAIDRLMGFLVMRVLTPGDEELRQTPVSDWLLYVRSHWLRMPPGLLATHLIRKSFRRLGGRREPSRPQAGEPVPRP